MFWGVTLESGKKYTQVVDTSFHVSMATLEPSNAASPDKYVMLMLEHRKAAFQLCALEHNRVLQVPLDLNFVEGEEITLYLNGAKGTVHLSGYLTEMDSLPGVDDDDDDISEEDASEDEDDDVKKQGSSKQKKKAKKAAKPQPADDVEDETSDEDEGGDDDWLSEEDEEDEEEVPKLVGQKRKHEDSDADVQHQQNSVTKAKPQQKQGKGKAEEKKKDSSFSSASTQGMKSPESHDDSQSKPKRKRHRKAKAKEETNAAAGSQAGAKSSGKQLQGGVQFQDLRVGNGPVARPGKTVHVYYVGRLTDNREFDSCKSGKAFAFKLGKGDVIKGWEKGIEGMRVGGKRKLIVPPGLAYGNNRVGNIPANSTLIFEVELKAVS